MRAKNRARARAKPQTTIYPRILLLKSPCSFVGSSGTKFAAPGVLDASGVLDAA